MLLSSSHFGAYHGNCYYQLMVDFMSILVKRILKTLLIICAMMDFPYELFVLVKRSIDILCFAMLKQRVITYRIVSTPFSIRGMAVLFRPLS